MKRVYPDVDHQFVEWYLGKSATKKLTEKAKKKDCGDLYPWIKSVSNHLWWCADTCNGDKELLREKWIPIIHHPANIHHWDSADHYHECPYPLIQQLTLSCHTGSLEVYHSVHTKNLPKRQQF